MSSGGGTAPGAPSAGARAQALYRALVLVPLGALVCSVALDVLSLRDGDQFIFAKGAYVLTGLGLAGGALAAVIAVPVLLRLPRDAPEARDGRRGVVLMDLALAMFAVTFVVRHRAGSLEPVSIALIAVAAVGAALLVASVSLSPPLAPSFGPRRVADDEPDAARRG